jgi:photosystem II stability/assembly factor-like uncharacterized protein
VIRFYRPFLTFFACLCALWGMGAIEAQQVPPGTFQEMRWRMIGPFRGGRTRAATGVPSQPNVFYMAQVNGGVWKSDDYGRTWNPIFDAEPSQSVGAIAVAPSDPNIIYVASGEGLARPDLSVGDGIYKSTDAGKTWTHLGLRDGEQIPGLAIDPRDPNRVFAAVLGHPYGPNEERGIFLSTDGGQNWKKVLYKNENTGGSDVVMDPSNPDVMYASLWEERQGPWEDGNEYNGPGGGLFKSTDGGNTWNPLTNGLPKNISQIYVAIAPSDTKRLYASLAGNDDSKYGPAQSQAIYRSDDAGENWYRVTTDPRPAIRIGGGDLAVPKVDPKNPDLVYSTSIVTMKSTDGGKSWMGFRGAPGGDDYQNIWINPDNPKIILLVSDQGGLVTVNGGESWSTWYNQPTAQLYHVEASNGFPYRVCSGQQESGSVCISSRGNDGNITIREWHPVGAIEYGYVAPDPLDPDVVYGAGRTEVSRFHWSTGQSQDVSPLTGTTGKYRTVRTEPLMFSPVDPHILYFGASVLFKTMDGGHSWQVISPDLGRKLNPIPASLGKMVADDPNAEKQRGVIYSLAPSFMNVNVLWAGTSDGLLWMTGDGGKNWKNVTPAEITPWSKITQIAASHFDEVSAYATASRFRTDDLHPFIYRTHDGGKSWQSIVNGLPENSPVNTIREDPVRKGLLFAGTETSVWVSFDDGDHWQPLQLNLPHTSMRDLWIHDNDLIVATHGRSFWILDDLTPLRQVNESVAKADAFLFKPELAYRVKRSTYSDTPMPPDEPAGQNPPDGAVIDYYLAQPAAGAVTLEILDAQGKVVRRYSSKDKPEVTQEELEKQLIPLYWIRMPKILPATAGMHRWVWDLHYATPDSLRHDYPISAVPGDTPRLPLGPNALPGKYSIKLTVNGQTSSEPLLVKMDPRVKTPAAGLTQLFQMEDRLAEMMTESTEAVTQARSATEQLAKLSSQASGSVAAEIAAMQKKLAAAMGGAGGPGGRPARPVGPPVAKLTRVNGEVSGLYGELDRADATPTAAQAAALTAAEHDYAAAMKQWEALKKSAIPALNRQLRGASLPEIHLESATPEEEEPGGDLE